MPGSFTFTPSGVPLGRPSATVAVFRYDGESSYQPLPNIRCLSIQRREGADPWSARFRYTFGDPLGSDQAPLRFEQCYPLDATGPLVVSNDDRLVVFRFADDGEREILFDGFVSLPQADLGEDVETVSFTAAGTPVREWDTPLAGALMRDADEPLTVSNVQTDLPARFNPDNHPNAAPADDTGDPSGPYCVFLGPVWPANKINDQDIRAWTLPMAARYVIGVGNKEQKWTTYGNLTDITSGLVAWKPAADGGPIDVTDPATYTVEDIIVPDYDVTGECWPTALERLLEPHGFGMRFDLSADGSGNPEWTLAVYRKDDNNSVKSLYLQEAGNILDPGQTNVGAMSLARDAHDINNWITIDARPVEYEASFVLVPGFHIDGTDSDAANLKKWIGEDPPETYRLFVFDECGEGWWDLSTDSWTTGKPGDLATLLNAGADTPNFVKRRRPGRATLITVDSENKPKRWQLHVSKDYAGTTPGVWDGTGTWQEIHSSECHLLADRLGVKLTMHDPNNWSIGRPAAGAPIAYNAGGVLKLVEWLANPTADYPAPILRVTCRIDGDQDMGVQAARRPSSPTSFSIQRRVDARDRFRKRIISKFSSEAGVYINKKDQVPLDDTKEAQAVADGIRRAREAGVFGGSVTVPRITTAYRVGDKVDEIDGRGVSLQMNVGNGSGESPIYPTVVGITWTFDGRQATTIELSDRRAEPAPKHRDAKDDD
jgi:hypothetical protein